ncbi:MAG TPA: molybdate ABC transporter substrate-binding protein, partial [Kiloniellaceae bacterium]
MLSRLLRYTSLLAALCLLAAPLPAAAQAGSEPVTVFAAASTADALNEIAEAYAVRTSGSLRPVVASSSTLARQIEQGAPADIFLSASAQWMDHLDEQKLLASGTRVPLLSNRLVLIAPADSPLSLRLSPGLPLGA